MYINHIISDIHFVNKDVIVLDAPTSVTVSSHVTDNPSDVTVNWFYLV